MDKEDFEGIKRGLAEVAAYMAGAREGYVIHAPADPGDPEDFDVTEEEVEKALRDRAVRRAAGRPK